MTMEQIKLALSVLELRERLIFKLAVIAGLRPERFSVYGALGYQNTLRTFRSGSIASRWTPQRRRNPSALFL
jgi:hypothetical protein